MRVLVADNEKDFNKIITERLIEDGYSVDSYFDGEDIIEAFNQNEYDALIIDTKLPKINGYEVLKQLRNKGISTPVMLMSATASNEDYSKGLDSGANEFISKPFAYRQMISKMQGMMKSSFGKYDNIIQVSDLILNLDMNSVFRAGQAITLTANEYILLEYLMINANKVLEKEKIEEQIWYFDYNDEENVLEIYMNRLINKIDKDHEEKLIHKICNGGYMLKVDKEDDK